MGTIMGTIIKANNLFWEEQKMNAKWPIQLLQGKEGMCACVQMHRKSLIRMSNRYNKQNRVF